jgi:hypothetical protein
MNTCSICLEDITNSIKPFNCTHKFHIGCINKWIDISSNKNCPYCRSNQNNYFRNSTWSNGTPKLEINGDLHIRYWSNGTKKYEINIKDNTGFYWISTGEKKISINQIPDEELNNIKNDDFYVFINF